VTGTIKQRLVYGTVVMAVALVAAMPGVSAQNAPFEEFTAFAINTAFAFTYNVGDIRLTLNICAPPPGNQDSGDYLLTICDQIMNSPIAVTDMRPGLLSVGGQDLPTYDLTVAVAVRRN